MVYFRKLDDSSTCMPFDTRLLEDLGRGVVFSSSDVFSDSFYIRTPSGKPFYKAVASIVICTYGRSESLNETLKSLTHQTFKDFEVLLITEKGDLAKLRQKGLESSTGCIVSFIDDDVYCPPTWLEGVTQSFREGVVGVSGPTFIKDRFRVNRDTFKYKRFQLLQGKIFGVPSKPGSLSKAGAPSMESNNESCGYEGEVDYLECCNMSIKKKEALNVGGFDQSYIRTGEWSELDLSFRLRNRGSLYFTPLAGLEHRPSKEGIYTERISTSHRWENFVRFQHRWVKPSFRRHLYWIFIWTYFTLKQTRMI